MSPAARHLNPFSKAIDYRKAGWGGTLPLPYKKKEKPPISFTGHRAQYPTSQEVLDWIGEGQQNNICIRLAGVDKEQKYELLGIDVDHYTKGNREKKGGDQLAKLEEELGSLPDTWIATSRIDGVSGIRFFRVPRGFAFRGQVEQDIECISKGYRYAIVWPSIHPDTNDTYWWFPPGTAPTEENRKIWNEGEIPDAQKMPELPESWLVYLTNDKMRTHGCEYIDMDSTWDEVKEWAIATFHGSENDACPRMREKLDKHILKIKNASTHHDKMLKAHMNIFRLAQEGHVGWDAALSEVNNHWFSDVTDANKRGEEINGEIFRSVANGLRIIKGEAKQRTDIGAEPIDSRCDRMGGLCSTAPVDADGDDPIGTVPGPCGLRVVDEYRMNDDGNAEHFIHHYSSSDLGPSVRWADGYGWLVWHGGDDPHWEVDTNGDQIIRRMWQKVRNRQELYVKALEADIASVAQQAGWAPGQLGPRGGVMPAPAVVKDAMAKHVLWSKFAEKSGNNKPSEEAIKSVRSISGVTIDVNELDRNPLLLGVANGVLELGGEDVILRKALPHDYITMNTNVPWDKPSNHAQSMWDNYLETFIPDEELRKVVQVLLGYCLVGGNKYQIFLAFKGDPQTGKSTMINSIVAAMGDYAMTVTQSMLSGKGHFNEILVQALNKRYAVCSEFDSNDTLSASLIKRITGGTDEITVPIKYSNAVKTGVPQFELILASNGVPQVSGSDKALQNRLRTIPFDHVIDPRHKDENLSDAVKVTCKVAVLNWLVEGYCEYRRLGFLPTHPLIEQANREYMSEMDEVSTFAYDMLKEHSNRERPGVRWQDEPSWCIQSGKMYEEFEAWWIANRLPMHEKPGIIKFTLRLKALGYKCVQLRLSNVGSKKYWVGLNLEKRSSNVIERDVAQWSGKLRPDDSVSS